MVNLIELEAQGSQRKYQIFLNPSYIICIKPVKEQSLNAEVCYNLGSGTSTIFTTQTPNQILALIKR